VALLHSRLSEGERLDEWERARTGAVDAVVGARSAIFSPLPDPGLIVLDEEHDASYKQDRTPRYHAREVAIRLAHETGAVVVLGSATPDVTSYYRALHGTYRLLEMTQRPASQATGDRRQTTVQAVGGRRQATDQVRDRTTDQATDVGAPTSLPPVAPLRAASAARVPSGHGAGRLSPALPPVEVVDLRQELQAGNRSIFSRALQAAVREALRRQEQIILFLNRRGSATFVICRDCGFVVRCPYCDLPYTYHSATAELICHRCDDRARPPEICRRCGGWRIRYFGLGTQRVEEEACRHFPGARLLRWDRDVGGGRHGHEQVLDRFARGEADILVGTQMVAKGLDIPRVTVVGVVSADTALNLPDFRSSERAFQLLTQVAGRAGRHVLPGRVVVQTYAPDHFAILAAARHDYTTFYEQEIVFRAEAGYPPFTQLLRLVYSDASEETCRAAAEGLAVQLRGALALVRHGEVIGPAPCFIGKIAGRYQWQVLVRADDVHPLLPLIPPGWTRDVDPMSLL
jgi:primosomal protein N' (replication factor Y)